ncbi:MAG: hypothetical protein HC879_18025 [Leptolyngbyaceae cyanobacterium SL_5_9]|nr:hypothetical protein [Leptolyngbyaceae cyanobacterium SL_5_9]
MPERSGGYGRDRPLRLVVGSQGAQEIGVGAVVRGDRWVARGSRRLLVMRYFEMMEALLS